MKKALKKVLLVLVIVATFFGGLYAYSYNLPDSKAYRAMEKAEKVTITVIKGEILDDLASDLFPGVDPRYFGEYVQTINNMKSADIKGGQKLVVPTQFVVTKNDGSILIVKDPETGRTYQRSTPQIKK